MLTLNEAHDLLNKLDEMDLPGHVTPITETGELLPAIQPGCLLYIQCGESTIVRVNEDMTVSDIEPHDDEQGEEE